MSKWLDTVFKYAPRVAGAIATGGTSEIVSLGLSILGEKLTGKPFASENEAIKAVENATPDQLLALKSADYDFQLGMKELEVVKYKAELESEREYFKQQQETIRNGDNASDRKIREVRPGMAIKSFWLGSLYLLVMSLLEAFGHGGGASLEIGVTLLAPCFAYMGLRTVDKKTNGGVGKFVDSIKAGLGKKFG